MSDPGPFIIATVALILVGAFVSLVTLIPPIRRWCRRSTTARIVTICTLGLVSFVISFSLFTRLGAEAVYVFGTFVHVDTFDGEPKVTAMWPPETEVNKPYVVRELWMRLLMPPGIRRSCYAKEAWICDLADDVTPAGSDGWDWESYLRYVGISCVSVVASSGLVWTFTSRKPSLKEATKS